MKQVLATAIALSLLLAIPTRAAEYQGQNIDGREFTATAYSYETNGAYPIRVRFRRNYATMTFAGGSQQIIRLNRAKISDLQAIEGVSRGIVNLGGSFWFGILEGDTGNLQPPYPRPLEGFWRISIPPEEFDRVL